MIFKKPTSWTVLALTLLSLGQFAHADQNPPAATPTPVPTPGVKDPSWKNDFIAELKFGSMGDQRKKEEMGWYLINPRGVIKGSDLIDLMNPVSREQFEKIMKSRNVTGDYDKMYQEYLGKASDQALGLLAVNRILDNEAMKHRMPPIPAFLRTHYVVKSILGQAAAELGKIKVRVEEIPELDANGNPKKDAQGNPIVKRVKHADEDIGVIDNEKMYAWLKEYVGKQPVRFNVDWSMVDGGMEQTLKLLKDREKLLGDDPEASLWKCEKRAKTPEEEKQDPCGNGFWKVKIPMDQLPDDLWGFQAKIQESLLKTHMANMRQSTWMGLVGYYNPDLQRQISWITWPEMQRMYEEIKDFYQDGIVQTNPNDSKAQRTVLYTFKLESKKASGSELRLSGVNAAKFRDRLSAIQRDHANQFLKEKPTPKPEEVTAFRATVLANSLEVAKTEFAQDIASGAVVLAQQDKALDFNGDAQSLPWDDSIQSKQLNALFGGRGFSPSLLPRAVDLKDGDAIVSFFVASLDSIQVRYRDLYEPEAQKRVKNIVAQKYQTIAMRETIYHLLKDNEIVYNKRLCEDGLGIWPCTTTSTARSYVSLMFPERLYKGLGMGEVITVIDREGNAKSWSPSDTIGRPSDFNRVAEVSLDLLGQAFQIRNYMSPLELPGGYWTEPSSVRK